MHCDYEKLSAENRIRYGTDIDEYGPMLLSDRYADRAHFIFELLQNAEDALRKIANGERKGAVQFQLRSDHLVVKHFGKPFDEPDVRAVCSIGKSTKAEGAIGKFGIGFKSVYTVTDRPEIRSGNESFAIECFVRPVAVESVAIDLNGATEIILPLKRDDSAAHAEISAGLQGMGPDALLFLRNITEIQWEVDSGPSGIYLRDKPEALDSWVDLIRVLGQESNEESFEETWIIFRQPLNDEVGGNSSEISIGFLATTDQVSNRLRLEPLSSSQLVVFFPTILETHLGYLAQGPYNTTPSRDNVLQGDTWNASLVLKTAELTIRALGWLRANKMLDVAALECLPLEPTKFGEKNMFAPVFQAVRANLQVLPLIPCADGNHAPATEVRIGRSKELRELLEAHQLTQLYGGTLVKWATGEITPDRTPKLYRYLRTELRVPEITPESFLGMLDAAFLSRQSDDWIARLYQFLLNQPALRGKVGEVPLVRLESGRHVTAFRDHQPQAFLPTSKESGFPTVRRSVCSSPEADKFLRSIGITEPDPVDEVVKNILPKYTRAGHRPAPSEYAADIESILLANRVDSSNQREKLKVALQVTPFVQAIDPRFGLRRFVTPGMVYIATERLSKLFEGVARVLLVDPECEPMRGEAVRDLLVSCGASRYLQAIAVATTLDYSAARVLRKAAGCEQSSGGELIEDRTIRGLSELLAHFRTLSTEAQRSRALVLWEALCDLADRSAGAFTARYSWFYLSARSTTFEAAFVRTLRETRWLVDADGSLTSPGFVEFESLDWPINRLVEEKLGFKPPIIATLAREAGIDPAVLDLIRKLNLTPDEIKAKLGVLDPKEQLEAEANSASEKTSVRETVPTDGAGSASKPAETGKSRPTESTRENSGNKDGRDHGNRPTPRAFVSYVVVKNDEQDPGEDRDNDRNMALEELAINAIRQLEPALKPTAPGNEGFDLYEEDEATGVTTRWVEVKSTSIAWKDRPVTLSAPQFRLGQKHGSAFWLYVVEHADDPSRRQIHRIANPTANITYFCFDHGWADLATDL